MLYKIFYVCVVDSWVNRQLSLLVSIKKMEEVGPILTSYGFGRALGSTRSKYLEGSFLRFGVLVSLALAEVLCSTLQALS